jgi:hypothetical protein
MPDQRPNMMQPKAYHWVVTRSVPLKVKVGGRMVTAGTSATVMRMVEIPSWCFKTVCTLYSVTVYMLAQRTERKEAIIPTEVTIRGK